MSDLSTALEKGVEPESDREPKPAAEAPADEPEAEEEEPGAEAEEDAADADEADSDSDDEDGEGEGDDEPDEVEIDFGGNKLTLKRGDVPDNVLEKVQSFAKDVWASATRKNQEIAKRSKSLAQQEQALERVRSLDNDALANFAQGTQLRQELEQLSQIDPRQLTSDDAQRLEVDILRKQRQLNDVIARVQTAESERQMVEAEERARRRAENERLIEREIKGFKTKHLPSVIDYAVESLGIDREAAENEWAENPAMVKAVFKAMQFDKLQARAKKPTPRTEATAPPKPNKGSGTGPKRTYDLNRDADKLSPEEWARRRNQEIARRNAR